jgi:methylase of polypeptide subunit release factors
LTVRQSRFGPVEVCFDEGVLEPRPWTLVQSRRAAAHAVRCTDPILELHCGAGHIGQAAATWSGRELVQIDDVWTCCARAKCNAERNDVASRVVCARVEELPFAPGTFAVVIADPPYLPTPDTAKFPDDPTHAVDGGPDGLEALRATLSAVVTVLRPGGRLVLQVRGAQQAHAVEASVKSAGLPLTLAWRYLVAADRAVMDLVRRPDATALAEPAPCDESPARHG